MLYLEEDLISDISYFSGDDTKPQIKNEYEKIGKKIDKNIFFDEYENQILDLNTVIRVDNYLRTPYSIHMSYPSARSLYTIKLYIQKEEYLLTKDFWKNKEVIKTEPSFYESNKLKSGDIVIELLEFKDKHYPSIFKTLQNLEVGHLLYNIAVLADIYGYEYEIDNKFLNILVLKQKRVFYNLKKNEEIAEFWERAKHRTSGKYYGGLINFDLNHEEYRYFPNRCTKIKCIKFDKKIIESVKTIVFINDDNSFINKEYGLVLEYSYLMKEYNYINARTMSQITVFLCKWRKHEMRNYAELIQYMGFLAQEICINNSITGIYNRPVKQMNLKFWNKVIKQNAEFKDFIPFYGVLTGRESVLYAKYKRVL